MNTNFFCDLVDCNLIKEWAEILDWLFDENRFSKEQGWSSGYVGKFTKKVNCLPMMSNNKKVSALKNLEFPKKTTSNLVMVIMGKSGSEGKDIVRHIRNGVAHGHVRIKNCKSQLWIEIEDFNRNKQQTAYLFFPIDYIKKIHQIYCEIEKSKNNDRNNFKSSKRKSNFKKSA